MEGAYFDIERETLKEVLFLEAKNKILEVEKVIKVVLNKDLDIRSKFLREYL